MGAGEDDSTRVAAAAARTGAPLSFVLATTKREITQKSDIKSAEWRHTENDLITLLPHLRNDRLPRINNTSEPDFDVLEVPEGLQDVLARYTHGAQSMKDRPTKPEWGTDGRVR